MVLRQPKADFIHKRYTAIDTSLYSGILQLNTWTETPKFTGQTALYYETDCCGRLFFITRVAFMFSVLRRRPGRRLTSITAKMSLLFPRSRGNIAFSERDERRTAIGTFSFKATHVKIGIETFSRISNDRLVVGYVTPVSPL